MGLPEFVLNVLYAVIWSQILFGAAQCFFGYRMFMNTLVFIGFVIGGAAGALLLPDMVLQEIGTQGNGDMRGPVKLGFFFLSGIAGGIAMVLLYYLAIFALGAFIGATLGGVAGVLLSVLNGEIEPSALLEPATFFGLVLALAGGVIALVLQKLIIIVATAFGGSWAVVTGFARLDALGDLNELEFSKLKDMGAEQIEELVSSILLFLGRMDPDLYPWWIGLAIVGMIVQYGLLPRGETSEDEAGHGKAVTEGAA